MLLKSLLLQRGVTEILSRGSNLRVYIENYLLFSSSKKLKLFVQKETSVKVTIQPSVRV